MFGPLSRALAGRLEVRAVEYPGRQSRQREPAVTSIRRLVAQLADELLPALAPPFALLGYSMGALVAFELARELRARSAPPPERLIVCAARPPGAPPAVDDDDDSAAVRSAMQRARSKDMDDDWFRRFVLPALRADLACLRGYSADVAAPLDVPISAIAGAADPVATPDAMYGWSTVTSRPFSLHVVAGGHLFVHDDEDAFRAVVDRALGRDVGPWKQLVDPGARRLA